MYLQKLALAAGLTIGVAMVSSASAVAAPFNSAPALGQAAAAQQNSLIVKVRSRGRRGRRGGRHHGGISPGAAAAIGVFGAIGTMMAVDAARRQQERDEAVSYCMRRFRSYDPVSMTYLGYDGFRHPCP